MVAEHAALDSAARQLMLEIGAVWAQDIPARRDLVLGAYGPLLNAAPKTDVFVSRDIAYGPHPRQNLDLFVPTGAADAPIAVFVHGAGGYGRGA
jgi:acetyl esterase